MNFVYIRDHGIDERTWQAVYKATGGACASMSRWTDWAIVWPNPAEQAGFGHGTFGMNSMFGLGSLFNGVIGGEQFGIDRGFGIGPGVIDEYWGFGYGNFGVWEDGISISMPISGLTNGLYSFGLYIKDFAGNISGRLTDCLPRFICNAPASPKYGKVVSIAGDTVNIRWQASTSF